MKVAKLMGMGWLIAALAIAGCNQPAGTAKKHDREAPHTHGKGPNDGVVFDLGAYHAEFTVDHDNKTCKLLFVTEDSKEGKPLPVAAKEFTLTTKETKTKSNEVVPPMTIKLLATDEKDGKAATFVGSDPGLSKVAELEGVVVGSIDGKGVKDRFKE